MSKYIPMLWDKNNTNKNNIDKLTPTSYTVVTNTLSKIINIIDLDATPVLYDVYNFTGVTYAVGTVSPEPAEAYTATLISGTTYEYVFKYAIYGFPVPTQEAPADYSNGATDWTLKGSIVIIKKLLNFPIMPEWALRGCKVISYLSNEDNSSIDSLSITLREAGIYSDAVTIQYNTFHRWIKLEEGYDFEFQAIYPIKQNTQTLLTTKLYFYNPKEISNVQSRKI